MYSKALHKDIFDFDNVLANRGYSEDIFLSAKRYSEDVIILHEKLLNQNEGDEYRYILIEELDFLTVE